jgi:hypothetical protein
VLAAWSFVALYPIVPNWTVLIIAVVVFVSGVAGSVMLEPEVDLNELKEKDRNRINGSTD